MSSAARLIRIAPKNFTIASVVLILFVSGCGKSLRPFRVVGTSMLPLLHPDDRIFVDVSDNARSNLHDGDVVVFRHENAVLAKRILAMPGETISGDHRRVFRDGKQLDEPYLAAPSGKELASLVNFPARKIEPDEDFVMGDNRDLSADSRLTEYGPVRFSDIVGKYAWTYWHGAAEAGHAKTP
jgi:signal peptidase I